MVYAYEIRQQRNLPFKFIQLLDDPKPDRVVWDKSQRGYALLTSTGLRFGFVRYNIRNPHKDMWVVCVGFYDPSSDPQNLFIPTGRRVQERICWLTLDDKPMVEYALNALRASRRKLTHKAGSEAETVLVKLNPDIPGVEAFGIVHLDTKKCPHTRNPRWERRGTAENVHAADEKYPDHRLFWCTRCFGLENPRRFDKWDHVRAHQAGSC